MDIDVVVQILREKLGKSASSNVSPKIIKFEGVIGSSNQIRCVMDDNSEVTLIVIQKKGKIYFQGPTEGRIISLEEFIGKSG